MVEGISIFIGCVVVLVIAVVYTKVAADRQFGLWFDNVLIAAKQRGMTEHDVDEIQEIWFWDSYLRELSPDEALTEYLKNN